MTLKEKIQRKIDMVEYYRETNCDKEQFSEKFDVSPNLFYDVRKISNDEEKFQELKARVNKKRRQMIINERNTSYIFIFQCNSYIYHFIFNNVSVGSSNNT